ncbi:hypothetical protein NQL31_006284 [Lotmaria passim]
MRTSFFWQTLVAVTVVVGLTTLPLSSMAASATFVTKPIAGNSQQDREGRYGTNSLTSPNALCAGYDPITADSIVMVGAANYMFTLNRYTTELRFFFGNPNATGTPVDWTTATSASFGTMRLTSPIYSCVTTARTASNSTIFYVSNDRYLYTANPDTQQVTATAIAQDPTTEYMWDIALYDSTLYVLTTNRIVYACTYASGISCTKVAIKGDAAFNGMTTPPNPALGIAVSADGIFIAPRSDLYWFSFTGAMIAKTSGFSSANNLIDVSLTQSVNLASGGTASLMAASATDLYSITISGSTLTATKLTTTAYTNSLMHIFPLTLDSVILTQPTSNHVQSTAYANNTVATTISHTPYPVSFVDQPTVLPLLLSFMDYELVNLAGTVPYPSVAIDTATVAVDPVTWSTGYDVDVAANYYTPDLGAAIMHAPANDGYPRSLRALESYYNRTNEVITGDYNLLPLCNITKMKNIRHSIAKDVRALLMYPFIYTSDAKHFTVNGQTNLTLIKLLMPYPFGTYLIDSTFTTNTTTHDLLATYEADILMVIYTRMNYDDSRIFDALFPVDSYPGFAALSPAQEQELRWAVYADVMAQLAKCAAAAGNGGNNGNGNGSGSGSGSGSNGSGSGSANDLVPDCKPRVGIDNMTQYQIPGVSPTPYNFTLFIPEGLYKNFNVKSCLDGTDWRHVNQFNQTLHKKHSKCGTGCIVGVAVASAVVAAILVVVIVILTSKRRRLATVVVPMSNAEPKFTSTVDADSNYGSGNPLAY